MWVEEGLWHDVNRLQQAAAFFESQIYPRTRAALGSEWTPGVDNDPHVLILHATGLGDGVAGYTSGLDELPAVVEPFSNEAEMILVDAAAVEVGSASYYALLARQLSHLIHWANDRNEAHWLESGLADLAVRLNHIEVNSAAAAYLRDPGTSLTAELTGGPSSSSRGAAYLFATYFHERFGDEGTRALVAHPQNGVAGVERTLSLLGAGLTFEEFFAEWLAANYLDSEPGVVPPYMYEPLPLERPALAGTIDSTSITVEKSLQQFGADYVVLRGESDLSVQFAGVTRTVLLNLAPHSGSHFWWSNRADESRSTLTKAFDLSAVEQATLTYWVWYDTEPGYDYAVVEVSVDDGNEWDTVAASDSAREDATGNDPGRVYTGRSGDPPVWVQETVDLSAYAGGDILVRFAYVTDAAITGPGFALDDIAVREIGASSGAETGEDSWEAAGFVRSDGSVPQRYVVLLISLGDRIVVQPLALDEAQVARWEVPLASASWREAILVISALAPYTTEPAFYSLVIESAEADR